MSTDWPVKGTLFLSRSLKLIKSNQSTYKDRRYPGGLYLGIRPIGEFAGEHSFLNPNEFVFGVFIQAAARGGHEFPPNKRFGRIVNAFSGGSVRA